MQKKSLQNKNVGVMIIMRVRGTLSDVFGKARCNEMEKVDGVRVNLEVFFKDVVDFIKNLWEYIDALMKGNPFAIVKKD